MKCIKCGKELPENTQFCSECGASQKQNTQPQNQVQQAQYGQPQYQDPMQQPQYGQPPYQNPPQQQASKGDKTLATCAVVFAFLMPIVGLILGIVGVCKIKDEKLKKQCILAIPVSIVVWIVGAIIMML